MTYKLSSVVPWGRTLDEYKKMFNLTAEDMNKKIASFGDGPASFNKESNGNVISFDPIYQFSKKQISDRINEVKDSIIEQTRQNKNNFIWKDIKDIDELAKLRMDAMQNFLEDFEKGKNEGRYIPHELPKKTDFTFQHFDIGLSSHFLLLYSELGEDFHIRAIDEMVRICTEVRIFPILNLDAKESEVLKVIVDNYKKHFEVSIVETDYEFQKGGNKMLVIKK
jgi:hypothetical protein